MSWEKLTICVKARKGNGRYAIGTGFPVARGLILTARHVVRPEGATGDVFVRWWHSKAEGFGPTAGENADGFLPAEIAWESDDLDVVLLEARFPAGVDVVHLASSPHQDGECESEGFPTGARIDGALAQLRVCGRMHTLDGSGAFFQVDLSASPANIADWGGLSGAAVIDVRSKSAVGVLVIARSALDQNRYAKAVPGSSVWQAPGFAERLRQQWRTYVPDAEWLSAHRAALRKLLAEHLSRLSRDRLHGLLQQCRCDNAARLATNVNDAAIALTHDCPASIHEIRAFQKAACSDDPDEFDRIGQIAWLVALLHLNDDETRLVAYMIENRDSPTTIPLGGPASTLTLLEIIAAAIDQQPPEYLPRDRPVALPQGRWCLPLCAPESGPGGDEVTDFVRHLHDQLGVKKSHSENFIAGAEDELCHVLFRKSRDEVAASGSALDDDALRLLRFGLKARRKDNDRSFYVPIILPTSADEAGRMLDCVSRLRRSFPEIVALALDPSKVRLDAEMERLIRLIQTVRLSEEVT